MEQMERIQRTFISRITQTEKGEREREIQGESMYSENGGSVQGIMRSSYSCLLYTSTGSLMGIC